MKGVAKTLGLAPKAPYVAPATTETVPLAPVETAGLREMGPSSVAPPEKSAEEIRKQQEADKAAADAKIKADADQALAADRLRQEQAAVAAGLRGRRSLLSSAGEVGFSRLGGT